MKTIFKIEGIGTEIIEGEGCTVREGLSTIGLKPSEWKAEKVKETATRVIYEVTRKPPKGFTLPEALKVPALPPHPKKVVVKRQLLIEALTVAQDIASKKSILPILSSALIDTSAGTLTLFATNLEASWKVSIPCDSPEPMSCVIPIALTLQEVKALPKDISEVAFTFHKESFQVNNRCELHISEADEYPSEQDFIFGEPVSLPGLLEALTKVAPAMSDDETRYNLTGARIDPENGKIVATDGFRLHMDDVTPVVAPALTVPGHAVKMAIKHAISDEIRVAMKAGPEETPDEPVAVSFSVKGGILTTRVLSGAYPDYLHLIPENPMKLRFSSKDFLQLLAGASPVSKQIVRLKANGALTVEADGDSGAYSWQIPCETEAAKDAFTLTFNPKFLMEALKSFQYETAVMLVPQEYGACIINEKAIVMPVRV